MTSAAVFFDTGEAMLLRPVKRPSSCHRHPTQTRQRGTLTIMRTPLPPSLVVSHKAEDRNSDEDGQDDVRGHDGHHRAHVN